MFTRESSIQLGTRGRKEFGIFARRAMVDQATSEKLNILVYLTLKRSSVLS